MRNVFCVAWRVSCLGLRPLSVPPSNAAAPLRSAASRDLRSLLRPFVSNTLPRRCFASLALFSLPSSHHFRAGLCPYLPFSILARPFSSASPSSDPNIPVEYGVQLRSEPFSAAEINAIFGKGKVSPEIGNRALAVLQGRREAGTLDLDLPSDVTRSVRKSSLDKAHEWLRANYPLDEDAAIYARIEREEVEEQQKLIRRAEELGLYKPQSGSYDAELGENDDPSGKSALKEFRKINEARLMEEQENKHREWLEGEERHREILMQQAEKNKGLQKFNNTSALEGESYVFRLVSVLCWLTCSAARPRADPQQRPVLAWIQKHHLRAMDNDVDISKMSNVCFVPSPYTFLFRGNMGLC